MVNVSVVAAWTSAETGGLIRAAVAGEFESALSRARPRTLRSGGQYGG